MTHGGMHQPLGAASWLNEDDSNATSDGPGITGGPAPDHRASGWTAPLKQGLIPLRPLQFGEILAASFRLLRTQPSLTVGSSVLVIAVTSILSGLVTGLVAFTMFERAASAAPEDRADLEATAVVVTLLTAVVTIVFSLVGTALLQGVLAHVVARAAIGEKSSFGAAWRAAGRRFWPLVGYTAVVIGTALVVLVLVLALIFAPAFTGDDSIGAILTTLAGVAMYFAVLLAFAALGAKLLFAPAAIMLEGLGPIAALHRSWRLTGGHFWRILGITVLVQLIAGVVSSTVSSVVQFVWTLLLAIVVPLGTASAGQEWVIALLALLLTLAMLLIQVVVSALVLVLTAGNAVILYFDVRMRKEGLNVHLQHFREAKASGIEPEADPFTAPPVEAPQFIAPAPAAAAHAPYGAPASPAPPYGAPASAAPHYGAPAYPAPHYGAPAYGAPAYGAPAYGAPPHAAPPYGPSSGAHSAPAPAPAPAGMPAPAAVAQPPASGFAPPAPEPAAAPGTAPNAPTAPAAADVARKEGERPDA